MSVLLFLLGGLIGGVLVAWLRGARSKERAAPHSTIGTSARAPVSAETDRPAEWTWTVDLLGTFTGSNAAGKDILGYDPAELVGRNIGLIMDPRELTRASAIVQATGIPDSGLPQLVVLARQRDGSSCWCETTVQTLTDPDGLLIGYQGRSRLIGAEAALVVTTERTRSRVEAMLADQLLMASFQPIVDLATGRVIGVEALSRFIAEPGDMPEAWFTDATTVGMGPELELLAIGTALTAARDLPEYLYVSINVSPLTCLEDRVEDLIRHSAIDLGRIVLELTEHTEVADYGLLNEALQALRRSGVRIAVDDAGAGFASGQHILRIKPDIIKLDRGLITDIDTDLGVRALAAGMVAMADEIGATVTAEGIETRAELKCVTALHIDAGQGYLLGRPSVNPGEWANWNSDGTFPELLDSEPPPPESSEPVSQPAQPGPAFVFSVAVLDALPDATAILDAAGRIIAVNKAWRMHAADNGGTEEKRVSVSATSMCARARRRPASGTRSRLSLDCARCSPEMRWSGNGNTPAVRRRSSAGTSQGSP